MALLLVAGVLLSVVSFGYDLTHGTHYAIGCAVCTLVGVVLLRSTK